ncbi:MOSC domain-containing protein [Nonomuraea longispora]|uniref:MOSC domain-containing protein n=1 Tax=Nonomuraea longispora TaxID=1848320 RepID=A0A4V2XKU4_9ACTN|nr:MOSC domain-containing protein [Nonomuraea longispora]TDC07846.1 MOSC domain-containing protein [Nonomuraea longispora]
MNGTVTAVSSNGEHSFTKPNRESVNLLAGHGGSGIDLLGLPVGTLLHVGEQAVVEVTGLRNPCVQIDRFQDGLLKQVVTRDEAGNVVRKAGIMSVVRTGGMVRPGDAIEVRLPAGPHRPLDRV